ncbi:hypothetical protein KR009_000689 [Drosophila setifemur]|nr:hypothetical protein KR009_000689 [Drosophila setifemur]
MFPFPVIIQLHLLVLLSCLAFLEALQLTHPGFNFHPSWLYSMPWRPLILPTAPAPTPLGLSQLSPGYQGPQTFPQDQDQQPQQQLQQDEQQPYQQQYQQQYSKQQQYQQKYPQQPVLLGLFTPQLQPHPLAAPPQAGHFTLPFRPSPFAGYTEEEEDSPGGIQDNNTQQQQPPFHVHSYKVAERPENSRGVNQQGYGSGGEARGIAPLGYVYLSPSNMYNLVRT